MEGGRAEAASRQALQGLERSDVRGEGHRRCRPLWTSPDLVESQLLFPVPCPMRCLERCWADIAQARVSSARVIEPLDVLANGVGGLLACREGGPPDQLGFDGLEDRFHHGVVVAVSPTAHRRDEAMVADDTTVV